MDSARNVALSDLEIERCNIVHLTKLIVKDILKAAVQCNRQLDEDNPLITQLLRVLECIVKHGLRPKKLHNAVPIIVFSNPDPWPVICEMLKKHSGFEIIETVNQMGIKTGLGKFRIWLKMALMQKQLGDYFHTISGQIKLLETFYYPGALLLQESGTEISGLLVGISIVDCNFLKMKDSTFDFESYVGPLNYSAYMNKDFDDTNNHFTSSATDQDTDEIIKNLLDQKNYTEELNSILQMKLTKALSNLSALEKSTANTKKLLAECTNQNLSLISEIDKLKSEHNALQNLFNHKSKLLQDDIQVERSTYQTSRQELNQMNLDLDKKLKEEVQIRLDADKSLQLEVQRRSDIELGLSTLEKQVQEKQQTILSLRKQMEQIKSSNIELNKDLKEKQSSYDHKSMLVDKLEEKTKGMANIMDQMDQRIKKSLADRSLLENRIFDLQTEIKEFQENCSQKDEEIHKLTKQVAEINIEIEKLKSEKSQFEEKLNKMTSQTEYLETELALSKKRICDQTETLNDMAKILEESKLETDGLREMTASFKEARWTDDKDVNQCVQCTKPFNVGRRKHHCRRCGGVFCHECSSNRMCLASSAKPMRVCDTCHNTLLKNYTMLSSRSSFDE